jgi:hypothetical protein
MRVERSATASAFFVTTIGRSGKWGARYVGAALRVVGYAT